MKIINSLNAIGLCLAALTPLASAQVPSLDARVDIDIVERDLSEVVQYLREKSGANIVVLEGGDEKVQTLKLSDVYWRDALDYAAESAGCVVEEDKSGVLTISSPYRVEFVIDDQDADFSCRERAGKSLDDGAERSLFVQRRYGYKYAQAEAPNWQESLECMMPQHT